MEHDYEALMWEETADLADYVAGLPDADWDRDSLCDGWRVRDVISHMCIGHTEPLGSILLEVAKHRFDIDAASAVASAAYADAHTPTELADTFSGIAANRTRRGISRLIPYKAGFTDHLVHNQDIRRPLGQPREIPEARLLAALDALPQNLGGTMPARKRLKSLKMTATDVDWTHGDGPEVRGPGEAIVLASLGRQAALSDLEGDGVAHLSELIGA